MVGYTALSCQIQQIKYECDVVLVGDFNVKLKISKETCEQAKSRNGKFLQEMITENNLTPATINADHGIWTRANRKIKKQKVYHRLHHGISKDNNGDNYCDSG